MARRTAALLLVANAAMSAETVTVAPGPEYAAGWLHRFVLGRHYRDLWTTPVPAEVLDLKTFAGGLTPEKRGGGQQTKSLRLRGANGREYAFRSVNKDPSPVLPPELRETIAGRVLRDQISSGHPGAPLVVAPLLAAAGVIHAEPRLFVMPDDPALGEYRAEFRGQLGFLEERPTGEGEVDGDGDFGDLRKVIGSDKLFERIERSTLERVDGRAFLRARLLDLFLGDWDRHRDQWRWARREKDGDWQPIPRDRDQAFSKFDGVLPSLAHYFAPQLVGFGESYPNVTGLTWNGRELDRRFLTGLDLAAWDATARDLRSKLTDEVIDDAVKRLPAPQLERNGAELAAALRKRRGALPDIARRFYLLLAKEVDLHTTRESEAVEVIRRGDKVEVSIAGKIGTSFQRLFDPRETREIRIYLAEGGDRVTVRGRVAELLTVRVISRDHEDVLDDSQGGGTRYYAVKGTGRLVPGPGTRLDRRPYTRAEKDPAKAPRDWGVDWLPAPWFGYSPDLGLFLGGGPIFYDYGFRYDPYRFRAALRAGYGTQPGSFRFDLNADLRKPSSDAHLTLFAKASGLEVLRFFGYGNETRANADPDFHEVEQKQYWLEPSVVLPVAPDWKLSLGPTLRLATTELEDSRVVSVLRPYGSDRFGEVGLRAGLTLDTRDTPAAARRGLHVALHGAFFPAIWDVDEPFGHVKGEASAYLTASGRFETTFAFRAGGQKSWGVFPFHEAAFLGGVSTVRGLYEQRFAGDAMVFGNAEARVFLTKFFLVLPGELGLVGLADTGRVFASGESSGKWHGAVGGGLWVAYLSRANTVTLVVARSEERTGLYFTAGFGF